MSNPTFGTSSRPCSFQRMTSACGLRCMKRPMSSSSKAFPWVRPYFNSMLEEYFGYLKEDAALLGQGLKNLKVFVERARSGDAGSSWIEHLMNEKQRELFNQMQTMMSVIEGYSNHVMNAVGRDLLDDFEPISRKFEYRQANRSQAELFFSKLTGLDVKMEQYRLGEQFIDAVVAERCTRFCCACLDRAGVPADSRRTARCTTLGPARGCDGLSAMSATA